jgi:hypothetical protein
VNRAVGYIDDAQRMAAGNLLFWPAPRRHGGFDAYRPEVTTELVSGVVAEVLAEAARRAVPDWACRLPRPAAVMPGWK